MGGLFSDIRRTLQCICCHPIQMPLCTVQLWEKITEKWLHGITGIQKSQNISMLGSSTHPMCSIHWLGEMRGEKRGNNWKTEFVRGFEVGRCTCQSSRWEQVTCYKKWCGFSIGFLLRSLHIATFPLVPCIEQMFSLDWSGAVS